MSSPTVADTLSVFRSQTVDRRREVRDITPCQGWYGVQQIFCPRVLRTKAV